jgi:hypothetical protein
MVHWDRCRDEALLERRGLIAKNLQKDFANCHKWLSGNVPFLAQGHGDNGVADFSGRLFYFPYKLFFQMIGVWPHLASGDFFIRSTHKT